MTDSTLTAIYRGWETYQGYLIQALTPLSNEQLQLGVAPSLWPISRIARHIIAARVYWYHAILRMGDPEIFKPMQTWDDFEVPVRSASDIIGGLRTTWKLMQDAIASWSTADLESSISRRRSDGTEETLTRQWIIWHVIEHDVHHGGEISIALGANGLTGLDL